MKGIESVLSYSKSKKITPVREKERASGGDSRV